MLVFPMTDPGKVNLDNYFLDRYIHTLGRLFLVIGMILLPVLIPINAIDGRNEAGEVRGLDKLSFSNVRASHCDRYWALEEYDRLRQVSLADGSWSASTLLVTTCSGILDSDTVRFHLGHAPGRFHLDMDGDLAELHDTVRKRNADLIKLEQAETALVRAASLFESKRGALPGQNVGWRRYLYPEERPQTRIPVDLGCKLFVVPFVGLKVDAINHHRSEIIHGNHEISKRRRQTRPSAVCFATFDGPVQRVLDFIATRKTSLPSAWSVTQCPAYEDIAWANLRLNAQNRLVRRITGHLLTTLLLAVVSFPVSLSQITYLGETLASFAGAEALPTPIIAVLQGAITPSLLVATISFIVPPSLRMVAHIRRERSLQDTEKSIQRSYFIFLFIQIFVVSSSSISIPTVIAAIRLDTESVPAILARILPNASNFFFSHIIITTASLVSSTAFQFGALKRVLLSPVLDKTARDKYNREQDVYIKEWGVLLPFLTNTACIGMQKITTHLTSESY